MGASITAGRQLSPGGNPFGNNGMPAHLNGKVKILVNVSAKILPFWQLCDIILRLSVDKIFFPSTDIFQLWFCNNVLQTYDCPIFHHQLLVTLVNLF